MALWGSVESMANTPIFATALINKVANSANRTSLYGNNSFEAGSNMITGVFGLDATEAQRSNSSVIMGLVSFEGSGYLSNTATATASAPPASGTAATANGVTSIALANGRITSVNVVVNGDKYIAKPTITLAPPAAQTFNASASGGAITASFVALTPNPFQKGDKVQYLALAGNTALTLLANATFYTVSLANSIGIKISNLGAGNPDIAIVGTGALQTHSFTGETATIELVLSHNSSVGAHPGWIVRKVFKGGRAGRVQYETLVAMSSLSGTSTPGASVTTPIKSS